MSTQIAPDYFTPIRARSRDNRLARAAARDLTCCVWRKPVAAVDAVKGGRPRRYCSVACRRQKERWVRLLVRVDSYLEPERTGRQDARHRDLQRRTHWMREAVAGCEALALALVGRVEMRSTRERRRRWRSQCTLSW